MESQFAELDVKPHQSGILIYSVILTILNAYNEEARFVPSYFHQQSSVTGNGMLRYLKCCWGTFIALREKNQAISKAKLQFLATLLIYNQDGVDVSFNKLTVINSIKQFLSTDNQWLEFGTYYHPGSKILPLRTVSRTDYKSVTTKLVPPPPRCDTHLGETSIHQIQKWEHLQCALLVILGCFLLTDRCRMCDVMGKEFVYISCE